MSFLVIVKRAVNLLCTLYDDENLLFWSSNLTLFFKFRRTCSFTEFARVYLSYISFLILNSFDSFF